MLIWLDLVQKVTLIGTFYDNMDNVQSVQSRENQYMIFHALTYANTLASLDVQSQLVRKSLLLHSLHDNLLNTVLRDTLSWQTSVWCDDTLLQCYGKNENANAHSHFGPAPLV